MTGASLTASAGLQIPVATPRRPKRPKQSPRRRLVGGSAGLTLLLAGGALAVRVAVLTAAGRGPQHAWLFTAAACVLAGVALVLIALPRIVPSEGGTDEPEPALPRG